MISFVNSGEGNSAWLYINGGRVDESEHRTDSDSGQVYSTGGRELTREVRQGDKIELRTTLMDGVYWYLNYCAEYVPKM